VGGIAMGDYIHIRPSGFDLVHVLMLSDKLSRVVKLIQGRLRVARMPSGLGVLVGLRRPPAPQWLRGGR
jgi:hypothetical protein